ncbi:hypothetical protein B296_00036880 [Ensete ventricosum]|uniref:Uncharacterized protein n=1 Tax=Ensete ventricosum TaxID=4639 RepID=A0A427A0Z8_ENSVE|nr:hypothetical protein B296_00036880 [Ensete ventricosum]
MTVSAELPLEFPDGTTPVACRVSVYDGSSDSKVGVGSLFDKASVPPLPAGSLYMEEVHAKVRIFQFLVDQMVIHSASDPRPRKTLCGDYFYNYFSRGLDILFDGQVDIKKKDLYCYFSKYTIQVAIGL